MSDERPSKRSQQLKERRIKIIEAAAELFILKGFHQASMRDIAGQAGISLGNLYNHFQGKADIIAAISELEVDSLEPLLKPLETEETGSFRQLEQFARRYFEASAELASAALSAEITAEAFRNPEIADGYMATRKRMIAAVERHLPSDHKNGSATAGLMIDLIERAGQNAVGSSKSQKASTLKAVLEFVERAVGPSGNEQQK